MIGMEEIERKSRRVQKLDCWNGGIKINDHRQLLSKRDFHLKRMQQRPFNRKIFLTKKQIKQDKKLLLMLKSCFFCVHNRFPYHVASNHLTRKINQSICCVFFSILIDPTTTKYRHDRYISYLHRYRW